MLVIVGLLLGGILKGRELIDGARVRNLADMNAGVQAAYYGFLDRYRQIPGDMTAAAAASTLGDATITAGGNANGRVDAGNWREASALWVHLTRAGLLQGSYGGGATSATRYRAATMAPQNAFNGYMLLGQTRDYSTTAGAPHRNAGGTARSRPRRQHSRRHRPGARSQDRRSEPPHRGSALYGHHDVHTPGGERSDDAVHDQRDHERVRHRRRRAALQPRLSLLNRVRGDPRRTAARTDTPSGANGPAGKAGLFKSRHWRGAAGGELRAGECRDRGHLALVRGRDALDPRVLVPRQGPVWRDTNARRRLLNGPGGKGAINALAGGDCL